MSDSRVFEDLLKLCRDSYSLWPENAALLSTTVAEAGFVYERIQDYVRCPVCRIRLFDWMPTSDPLVEHDRFSKGKCKLLNYIKNKGCDERCAGSDEEEVVVEQPTKVSKCVQCTDVEPINSSNSELGASCEAAKSTITRDLKELVSDYLDRQELRILLEHGADRELLSENVGERLRTGRDVLSEVDSIMMEVLYPSL